MLKAVLFFIVVGHSHNRSSVGHCLGVVVVLAGVLGCLLPAHEGGAAQGHEVHLAGTSGAHGGEENLGTKREIRDALGRTQ